MKKNISARIAAIILSLYVLVFITSLNDQFLLKMIPWLLIAFPPLFIWMVVSILRDNSRPYAELGKNEWAYRDKKKDELGFF